MTRPAPDGHLPAAKRELSDAISKLIDPKPHTIHHDNNTTSIRWIDSLYTQLVEAIPGKIDGWCDKIRELLNETPKLTLPNSCPNCETKVCYRPDPDGGPPLRTPALQIGPTGCTCQHCRYTWEPSHFALLAEVLGYRPIEGVLTT
jgi:hypothetical protein